MHHSSTKTLTKKYLRQFIVTFLYNLKIFFEKMDLLKETFLLRVLSLTICYMQLSVVVFCHSKRQMMGKFLLRAQYRNMTNGDYAFFTFRPLPGYVSDRPWKYYVKHNDISRAMSAFYVVKQVCACRVAIQTYESVSKK